MAAIFNYSRLPEAHIRLVRIKSTEDPPTCELYDAPFNDDLRFRAISYAWGSDKLTHRIKCNDMIMAVTESVADMFSSSAICELCVDMPIWVDAVCINQRDDPEKAVQVRMMGSLYSQAEEVIVWLGMASDDSDRAMRQLSAWSTNETFLAANSYSELEASPQGRIKAGIEPLYDSIYDAIAALYCRSWFTRLWVFQEIVMAQRCRLFCGSAEITLEQLVTVVQMGFTKQASSKEPRALAPWKHKGDTLTLTELMKFADEKGVTNPHDRVYGFIGLASPEARKRISIDYSDKSPTGWSKTYIQCAKACIQEVSSLSILFLLSGRPKGLPLPSWCPNFNANQRRQLVISPRSNAGILKSVQLEDGLPKAWVEEEKDILFAPGCQIDHVEEIVDSTYTLGEGSDPEGLIAHNISWERQCQSLSQRTLGTGIEKDIIYIQTLIENNPIPGKENTDLIRLSDHNKYFRSEGFYNAECKASVGETEAANYFSIVLGNACEDRIFFSTKGGRIGVGPPETQPGDLICILYGAGPLYVLRRGSDAKKPLQILGDAFVHGLMDLDDMYEQVRSNDEVFEIG
ncbi:hypothetical protein JMJ35_002035 [Cladonia borealis]|uniref:Heterokaryon incompatibility domain-containing protein n=1 Tax=Cladonia borealis TaxID=184061 RepID=A0AA39R8G2_9LECA|nr:hypothetical protein JMJ35_002035 [Cladonia borealis]